MITMHCPSCGAEGRIPKEKVDTRLICKKCLKSFHLTTTGKILAGAPFEGGLHAHHEAPGHEFDHVDEELDLIMTKLRKALRKAAIVAGVVAVLLGAWLVIRATRPLPHDEQAIQIARALLRNDIPSLHEMATSESLQAVARLSDALRPELQQHVPHQQAPLPEIELARKPDPPAPGLSEVVASVRTDKPVGRVGLAVPDISVSVRPTGVVEIPLILSGSDRAGWRLDGDKTLEAFQKSRTSDLAKLGKSGSNPR